MFLGNDIILRIFPEQSSDFESMLSHMHNPQGSEQEKPFGGPAPVSHAVFFLEVKNDARL